MGVSPILLVSFQEYFSGEIMIMGERVWIWELAVLKKGKKVQCPEFFVAPRNASPISSGT